jgi:Lrp/AsnC family transcriptional regulator, leucine-responsive regulatory protein
MTPDRYDAAILDALQKDGRKPIVELAEQVGLSNTPCARRVKLLEQAGIIQGYTAIIDPAPLGLKVQAFVQVRLTRHTDENIEQFRRAVDAMEEIVSCHAMTGNYDLLLQVVVPDLESLSNVVLKKLLRIRFVRDVHSSIVLNTIKRSARVPVRHLVPSPDFITTATTSSNSVNAWNPTRAHIKRPLNKRSVAPPPDIASRPSAMLTPVPINARMMMIVSTSIVIFSPNLPCSTNI